MKAVPPPPPASRCGPHFPACTMILGQLTGAAWERRGQPSLECLSPPQPRWCHADRRHLHRALKRGADPSRPQKLLFRFPKGRPTSKAPPPASPRLSGQPQRRTKHRALPPARVRAEPCQRDSVARSIAPGSSPVPKQRVLPGARARPAAATSNTALCCHQRCHHLSQQHGAPSPAPRCWGYGRAVPSTATSRPSHPRGARDAATSSPGLSLALCPSATDARSSLPGPALPPCSLQVPEQGGGGGHGRARPHPGTATLPHVPPQASRGESPSLPGRGVQRQGESRAAEPPRVPELHLPLAHLQGRRHGTGGCAAAGWHSRPHVLAFQPASAEPLGHHGGHGRVHAMPQATRAIPGRQRRGCARLTSLGVPAAQRGFECCWLLRKAGENPARPLRPDVAAGRALQGLEVAGGSATHRDWEGSSCFPSCLLSWGPGSPKSTWGCPCFAIAMPCRSPGWRQGDTWGQRAVALAQGGKSQPARSCLPSEDRTWLNPTEMRQSLAPIQSSRESLLFSCPGTLCKAQETRPSAFPPPAPGPPRGTRASCAATARP